MSQHTHESGHRDRKPADLATEAVLLYRQGYLPATVQARLGISQEFFWSALSNPEVVLRSRAKEGWL